MSMLSSGQAGVIRTLWRGHSPDSCLLSHLNCWEPLLGVQGTACFGQVPVAHENFTNHPE